MSDKYYSKISYIANALSDIESVSTIRETDEQLNYVRIKVEYPIRNLILSGFTEDYLITLSETINKAVKKALLKTERILLDELEGELESVKDSLTAEEEYQNGKE